MNIIVIGAGVIGVTTAYYLNELGADVTVLESLPKAGQDTSFANAGILTPSLANPFNAPKIWESIIASLWRKDSDIRISFRALPSLFSWGNYFFHACREDIVKEHTARNIRLAEYSLQLTRTLAEQHDAMKFDFAQRGTLQIYRDEKSFAHGRMLAEQLKPFGVNSTLRDPDATIVLEPALANSLNPLAGSIHFPEDAHGDAQWFTLQLADIAKQRGVRFFYDTHASHFHKRNNIITHVITDKDEFSCDAVILATGPYSPNLAKKLDIILPIRPCKGFSLTVDRGQWQDGPKISVVELEHHAVVTPLGSRLRITCNTEFMGYNKSIPQARVNRLQNILFNLYPESEKYIDKTDMHAWTGLRPLSADGLPFVGITPIPNFFLNTGHGHLGWTMAAGSGKLLADYIMLGKTDLNIADFRLNRY